MQFERGLEQYLADTWAVERNDIYNEGISTPQVLFASSPVRPRDALRILDVPEDQLVSFVRTGKLARPGKRGHGRVAWRRDEIELMRERLSDDRD